MAEELEGEIFQMLDQLSDENRAIFFDLFFKGLSYEDVEKKFRFQRSKLYNLVSRNRQRLKKMYQKEKGKS